MKVLFIQMDSAQGLPAGFEDIIKALYIRLLGFVSHFPMVFNLISEQNFVFFEQFYIG